MTSFIHRIEVHYKQDPRLTSRTDRIRSLGFPVTELHLIDIYTIATNSRDFTREELCRIGAQLINPVVQEYAIEQAVDDLTVEDPPIDDVIEQVFATPKDGAV